MPSAQVIPPQIIVDTRPLWRVALARTHHWITMLVAVGVFLWLVMHQPFEGLTPEGQRTLAVFVLCLILWVTQALPLSVTGLLALLLLPLCGIMTSEQTFALFGNDAIFFIIGAFIIAAAIMHSGLSTRVAMAILNRIGTTPRRLMIGLLVLAAALAHVMPEHAVAAMLLPIVIEIARTLRLAPGRSRMGTGLFLALAWGSIIGGIATFLGGARNPLAIEILARNTDGQHAIGFLEWWVAAFPLVLMALGAAAAILLLFFRPEIDSTAPAREALQVRMKHMGRPTLEERLTGLVLLLTVTGWVLAERLQISVAIIALLGAVALFALRVISWSVVERHVNWGIVLMYGGAIALGKAVSQTGCAEWIAHSLLGESLIEHPIATLFVLAATAIVLTEGMSNAAVVALMLPLALNLAPQIGPNGVDPRLMVFAIALPAGLAFTLPISTPPNALAHSTGFVTMRGISWKGPLLNLICLLAFMAVAILWWGPILGLR
jgi:solute carrier family 13 (sodium-dependent dicarboxylate transporter), member 2/3/5